MGWAFLRITSSRSLAALSLVRSRKEHRGGHLISDVQETARLGAR